MLNKLYNIGGGGGGNGGGGNGGGGNGGGGGGGVKSTIHIRQIERLLPKRLIESNRHERTVLSIVKSFHPRKEEYEAAGFTQEEMEERERSCEIFIPVHQRFFVWPIEHQQNFIDSIFKNFPIPGIMVSKSNIRGVVNQEGWSAKIHYFVEIL